MSSKDMGDTMVPLEELTALELISIINNLKSDGEHEHAAELTHYLASRPSEYEELMRQGVAFREHDHELRKFRTERLSKRAEVE